MRSQRARERQHGIKIKSSRRPLRRHHSFINKTTKKYLHLKMKYTSNERADESGEYGDSEGTFDKVKREYHSRLLTMKRRNHQLQNIY